MPVEDLLVNGSTKTRNIRSTIPYSSRGEVPIRRNMVVGIVGGHRDIVGRRTEKEYIHAPFVAEKWNMQFPKPWVLHDDERLRFE